MATRDDHVITVSYPDGTTIVEHADGTRITTYYKESQAVDNDDMDFGINFCVIIILSYFQLICINSNNKNMMYASETWFLPIFLYS